MSKIIPINNDSPNIEIPLNDEEMLDILGSLLMDEFYASEIWQPVPAMPKRKKAKARRKPGERYMQAYINQVLLLLPEDKAQEWRDAHPTKEDLLKKEVEIELPKRIPFPDGILDQDKSLLLYSVFPSLPFDEYVSMAMSLFRLFLDEEKAIKSFKIFSSDDMKRLKSDFEEFNIVAHHIKPRVSYESNTHQLAHLVSSLFILCFEMGEFTEKKRTFVKALIDKVSDVIWRDWDSDKLRDEIREKQDFYQSCQRLEKKLMAETESLKSHISKLAGEGLADYLMDKYKFLSKRPNFCVASMACYRNIEFLV